jgi:hypothetical protein
MFPLSDSNGWLYYASPCQPVRGNAKCLIITTPAVCQLEPKSVWPLGSITKGTVGPRAPKPPPCHSFATVTPA